MTALATDRNTVRAGRHMHDSPGKMGVKASTKVYAGSLVVEDAGVMAPGRTATGLTALGVARNQYDNTSGAANAITGEYDMGDFWFGTSSAGDAIAAADVGNTCYIVDDQTVAKTDGTGARSAAGKVIDVDSTLGVLVRIAAGL